MSAYEPFPADAESNRLVVEHDGRLASRAVRFGALVIDGLLIGIVAMTAAIVLAVATGGDDETVGSIVFYLVYGAILLLYYPLTMSRDGRRNGQTFGKQWLKIRVVTAEGVPVTFWRAARRDVLGTTAINFVTVGLYALIDYPFGLFSANRQCLHDKIGNTFVFRADASFAPRDETPTPPPEPPRPEPPAEPEAPRRLWAPPSDQDRARDEVNRAFGR